MYWLFHNSVSSSPFTTAVTLPQTSSPSVWQCKVFLNPFLCGTCPLIPHLQPKYKYDFIYVCTFLYIYALHMCVYNLLPQYYTREDFIYIMYKYIKYNVKFGFETQRRIRSKIIDSTTSRILSLGEATDDVLQQEFGRENWFGTLRGANKQRVGGRYKKRRMRMWDDEGRGPR